MKVLRRSFLGAVLSSIPLLRTQADLIWVGDKYIKDPFIKIYTSQDKIVKYKEHTFKQSENYILHYITNKYKTFWNCYIPIDTKANQKEKKDMLREINKYRFDYECFELIADNGKSNVYAVCDNDKFQASLSGDGKSQC